MTAFHTPKGYQDSAQGVGFAEPWVSKGSKDLIPVQTYVFRLQSLASRLSDVQNY